MDLEDKVDTPLDKFSKTEMLIQGNREAIIRRVVDFHLLRQHQNELGEASPNPFIAAVLKHGWGSWKEIADEGEELGVLKDYTGQADSQGRKRTWINMRFNKLVRSLRMKSMNEANETPEREANDNGDAGEAAGEAAGGEQAANGGGEASGAGPSASKPAVEVIDLEKEEFNLPEEKEQGKADFASIVELKRQQILVEMQRQQMQRDRMQQALQTAGSLLQAQQQQYLSQQFLQRSLNFGQAAQQSGLPGYSAGAAVLQQVPHQYSQGLQQQPNPLLGTKLVQVQQHGGGGQAAGNLFSGLQGIQGPSSYASYYNQAQQQLSQQLTQAGPAACLQQYQNMSESMRGSQ